METKVPVEIDIEHQKLSKMEVEFESLFQFIEHECDSKEEFDSTVLIGRAKITSLKQAFNKFQQSSFEWESNATYDTKIKPLVESHNTVYKSSQNSFRKACINGQKRLSTLERTQLLLTPTETDTKDSKVRQRVLEKSEIAKKQAEMKENMLNIARMLDSQVKLGESANATLETSSQKIEETHEELKSLTGIISISRKLLNKYNRRELTDTLLIFFGLVLFFATCLYIVSKRI